MDIQYREITLVGCGLNPATDLTNAARKALKAAHAVFAFRPQPELRRALAPRTRLFDIRYLYRDGALDTDNYLRIVTRLVKASKVYQRIVLLVPGHPRVGVTIADWLEQLARTEKFRLSFISGLSSLDAMLTALSRDCLHPGTLLLDANRLLLYDLELNPQFDTYIYHICSVGNPRTEFRMPSRDNHLCLLQEKLLTAYNESDGAWLVEAPTGSRGCAINKTTIGKMMNLLEHISFNSTLFLPSTHIPLCEPSFQTILKRRRRGNAEARA